MRKKKLDGVSMSIDEGKKKASVRMGFFLSGLNRLVHSKGGDIHTPLLI